MRSLKSDGKRIAVAILGGSVLVIGIIAIPYPGPGWLIVFAGLGILATEFEWAKRVLEYARGRYDAWQEWLANRPFIVRAGFWMMTAVIVIMTIWLLNGYGLLNDLLGLHQDWLDSPVQLLN